MISSRRHPRHPRQRRGIALADVIIGGVMLGIALGVILTVASRALAMQTSGEKRLVASWLADEILTTVLVEGPDQYPRLFDTAGRFGDPFKEFTYEVDIDDLGGGAPYRVNAVVRWSDRTQDEIRVETLIALRGGEEEQLREPYEAVDRDARNFDEDEEGL